jgi:hypothetical protein
MAFDFPANPVLNQVYAPISGIAYQWNGFAWQGTVSPPMIVSGDQPPSPAIPNQLWFESDSGNFFISYFDGNSQQWVQINGVPEIVNQPTLALVTVADAAPSNPMPGQQWYETDTGVMWIWIEDVDSAQWVQVGKR